MLNEIISNFKAKSITFIMGDCGTGKTFTTFKLIEHDIASANFWMLITNDGGNLKIYLPEQTPLTVEIGDFQHKPTVNVPQIVLTENIANPAALDTAILELAASIVNKAQTLEIGKFKLYIDDVPNDITTKLINVIKNRYGMLADLNIKLLVTDYGDLLKFLIELEKEPFTTYLLEKRKI